MAAEADRASQTHNAIGSVDRLTAISRLLPLALDCMDPSWGITILVYRCGSGFVTKSDGTFLGLEGELQIGSSAPYSIHHLPTWMSTV